MTTDESSSNPATPAKGKEPMLPSPMLSLTNYNVWALRMKAIMKVYKVWETVTPRSDDQEKNDLAVVILYQSLPETVVMQLGDLDTAKGIWDAIKSGNVGADRVKEARLQTLSTEFDNLKMKDTDSIDEFSGKLSGLANRSAALGDKIAESKLVKKSLKSLPLSKYIHIVAALEQTLDLNTIGYEDIVGRMKAYEERLKEDDVQAEPQSKLLYSKAEQSSHRNYDTKGKFRGLGRGRGRGNYGNKQTHRYHESNSGVDNGKGKERDMSSTKRICNDPLETRIHIFEDCSSSKRIWSSVHHWLSLDFGLDGNPEETFQHLDNMHASKRRKNIITGVICVTCGYMEIS